MKFNVKEIVSTTESFISDSPFRYNKRLINQYNKDCTAPKGKRRVDRLGENAILTEDVFLGINSFETRRNLNTFVLGEAGSGTTKQFIKPNLLQGNTSFVLMDPNGAILESVGSFLKDEGYKIRIFNLVDMEKSYFYNPFFYIDEEKDISLMVDCLMQNTPGNHQSGDRLCDKYEKVLLETICLYITETKPKEKQNFSEVTELLRELSKQDEENIFELEKVFEEYKKSNPDSPSVKRYEILKNEAKKFWSALFVSASIRLVIFNLKTVANLTSKDTIELEKIGDEKTAVFCVMPALDNTLYPLVTLLYTQTFTALCNHAEKTNPSHKLPVHVRFFCNTISELGLIPELQHKIAFCRPYNISFSIIVRNLAEMKKVYPDKEERAVIIGNCDSFLFFGAHDVETFDYIMQRYEKEIVVCTKSKKQYKNSFGLTEFFSDMKNDSCLVYVHGVHLFYGKKFDYEKHPNFKYTGDADKRKVYEISKKEE